MAQRSGAVKSSGVAAKDLTGGRFRYAPYNYRMQGVLRASYLATGYTTNAYPDDDIGALSA